MENCPAWTLFPAKGCPTYRSSPVKEYSRITDRKSVSISVLAVSVLRRPPR
jgi:hypothetical protein